MSGDPTPPRLMPPTCCPFHESVGHWDSGHRQVSVIGHYGDERAGSIGATAGVDAGVVQFSGSAMPTGTDVRRFSLRPLTKRYPGEGNRRARRAAAKGKVKS